MTRSGWRSFLTAELKRLVKDRGQGGDPPGPAPDCETLEPFRPQDETAGERPPADHGPAPASRVAVRKLQDPARAPRAQWRPNDLRFGVVASGTNSSRDLLPASEGGLMAQTKSRAKGLQSSKSAGKTQKRSGGSTRAKSSRNGSKAVSTKATSSSKPRSAAQTRKRSPTASKKTGSSPAGGRSRTRNRRPHQGRGQRCAKRRWRRHLRGRQSASASARWWSSVRWDLGGRRAQQRSREAGRTKMLGIGPLAKPKVKIRSPKTKVKIRSQDVASVAKDIGAFGEQMGKVRDGDARDPRGRCQQPSPVARSKSSSKA